MAQEIEIEFKTLLKQKDFSQLRKSLPFPNQATNQANHYFDTKKMTLKQHQSALRIREKNGTYTLTLKQPDKRGILETHDTLTHEECVLWLNGQPIAKPHTTELLAKMNVHPTELIYYGSLQTKRYAFNQDGFEIVLDESNYLGKQDFELELETKHYESGRVAFDQLLDKYTITKQEPITKVERFFRALGDGGEPISRN